MKSYFPEKNRVFPILFCVCLFLLFFLTCSIDHGLEPIFSKISGKVYFKGEIPPDTDEVRVAVAKEFPPRSINELLFSDMIPFWKDSAEYEIYLSEGTYDVVGVVWKEHNLSWNISDVIGIYGVTFFGNIFLGIPKSVTIADKNTVLESIDIETNLDRVDRDAKIKGTVTFTGMWPENTGLVGIGAFRDVPQKGNPFDYFFKNASLDYSVPLFTGKFNYQLRVNSSDTLKYIAVLWIDDSFDLTKIKDIGFYKDPYNPENPGTVSVTEDSTLSGIDINVDFSEI